MRLPAVPSPHALTAVSVGLIAAFALAAATVLPVQSWVFGVASRLNGWGVGGALIFTAIYAAGAMALVPASAFSLAAGLIYGGWGILISWLAMMGVAATSFPLARRFLASRVRGVVDRRRLLRTVATVIDEEGWRMVLLVRISGIVPFGLQKLQLRPHPDPVLAVSARHVSWCRASSCMPGLVLSGIRPSMRLAITGFASLFLPQPYWPESLSL